MDPTPSSPAPSRAWRTWSMGLTAAFGVFISLPLANQLTGQPHDRRLNGVEEPKALPRLTWTTWLDASFARAVEQSLNRRIGLRGYLITLANQANYSLFGKLPASGTPIDAGRDHWLFEHAYVSQLLRRPNFTDARRDEFATKLTELHRELARRGKGLAVVVAPGKPEIYPEFLPADLPPPLKGNTTAYEQMIPALETAGVPVLDVRKRFLARKADHPYLFPPGGTHWSHYGAQLATDDLFDLLRRQSGFEGLTPIGIAKVEWKKPAGTDRDLRDLLNLWWYEPRGAVKLPYPVVAPAVGTRPAGLGAVVIGDSFSFTLIDALARTAAFDRIDLLYYFKRRFSYTEPLFPAGGPTLVRHDKFDRGPLPAQGPDWAGILAGRTAVILVINEVNLYSTGWGSVENLLQYLRDHPDAR